VVGDALMTGSSAMNLAKFADGLSTPVAFWHSSQLDFQSDP